MIANREIRLNKTFGTDDTALTGSNDLGSINSESEVTLKELTEFDMVEEVGSQEVVYDTTCLYKQLLPFRDQTPTSILSRKYEIARDNSWDGTPFHVSVGVELLRQAAIQDALNTFRYMRADVEITVQLVSVPTQYGLVFLSNIPWHEEGLNPAHTLYDIKSVFSSEPMVMPISTTSTVNYVIPYKGMLEFLPLSTDGVWDNDVFGFWHAFELYMGTLVGIEVTDSSVPDTISYQIWASFKNPVVHGYSQAQADIFAGAAAKVITNTPEFRDGIGYATSRIAEAGKCFLFGECEDVNLEAGGNAKATDGKDGTLTVSQDTYGDISACVPRKRDLPNLESRSSFKLPQGTYGFNPRTMLDIARVPSLLTYGALGTNDVFWFAADIGRMVDPDYSTSSTYLTMISRLYRFWRGGLKIMIMLVNSPLMVTRMRVTLSWNGTTPVTEVGDVTSKIITVRGTATECFEVPYFRPTPWSETTATPAYADSINLPLTGTLWPRIEVKMLSPSVVSGNGSGQVQIYVWVAAGDDFQLASPQAPFTNYQAPPPLMNVVGGRKVVGTSEAQMNIREVFSDKFEKIGTEFDLPHSTTPYCPDLTIEEFLSRYSSRPEVNPAGPGPLAYDTVITPLEFQKADAFDYISNMFLFWRGATRHKWVMSTATQDACVAMECNSKSRWISSNECVWAGSGNVRNTSRLWRIIQAEVPFLSPCHVAFVRQPPAAAHPATGPGVYDFNFSQVETVENLISAGEGFQLFFLMPPYAEQNYTLS